MSRQMVPKTAKGKKEKGKSKPKKGVLVFEQRRHPRIFVELPFDYTRIDSKNTCGGIVANAGEGGLLVYLHEAFEIGALLKIGILFAKGFEMNAIQGIAKVVWSDLATKKIWGEYRYGLQFQSFQKGDLRKLKNLLEEVGKSMT
jgi:hypothetical protein